jgi:hypothetical protein
MNENVIIEQLRELRLCGFLDGINEQRTSSRYAELPFEERLALLLDRECLRRGNERLLRRLKNACIRQSTANLDSVDLRVERGLSKQRLLELGGCHWVRERLSLVVTGPTGSGKSFISSALADQACRLSFTALYTRASDLIADLLLSKADGSALFESASLELIFSLSTTFSAIRLRQHTGENSSIWSMTASALPHACSYPSCLFRTGTRTSPIQPSPTLSSTGLCTMHCGSN